MADLATTAAARRPATAACLAVEDLAVTLGGRAVVRGASVRVAAGEAVAVEGPSGCGKSTLLRAIVRLVPLAGGRVLLDGVDAATLPVTALRRAVALVPQRPRMFDGTVADNVGTGPALRGATLAAGEVAALLARVGLDPALSSRPAAQLSGGEQQRVAIARALANAPRVLLLDEPTSALDAAAAARVLALLAELRAAGLALLLVTHVHAHAAAVAGAAGCYRFVHGRLERAADSDDHGHDQDDGNDHDDDHDDDHDHDDDQAPGARRA